MPKIIIQHDSGFQFFLGLPPIKVKEALENDETAINYMRAMIAPVNIHPIYPKCWVREFQGHKYYLKFDYDNGAMDQILQDFLGHGEYEPHTTKLVEEYVKPDDVCVDVGASIGYFTLLFARLGKEVYSVEPTRNQFEFLKENVKLNKYEYKVKLFNLAASDKKEDLHIQANATQDHMDAVPLDSILPKKVDFVKIDVDGSEPKVLKGLVKTIERNPQLKMIIEYYPSYIEKLGNQPQEMLEILDKYFTYSRIDGEFDDTHFNYFCTRKMVK